MSTRYGRQNPAIQCFATAVSPAAAAEAGAFIALAPLVFVVILILVGTLTISPFSPFSPVFSAFPIIVMVLTFPAAVITLTALY